MEIVGLFKPRKVQLVSLGCSKNRVDSEKLLSRLSAGDIEIVDESTPYNLSKPDVVVINTCGFIESAKQESINEIFKAIEAKQKGFVGKVVVCGCLSERYKGELGELIPEADAIFGSFEWKQILEWMGLKTSSSALWKGRFLTTPRHYAYLKIADGCNRKCSYCAIPLIKGRYISVPLEQLVKEAELLAKSGVRELILIAQDTTFYGMDLYKKRMLAPLLEALSAIEGIEWIRIHYSYPTGFPMAVLEQIASNPKICKYIDIPLQHCSTSVLKSMRRATDFAKTQALIDKMRSTVPGVALRTTMIVGHPGEGKREFNQLLDFVRRNQFEMLGAFEYSPEEGTYSCLNYKDSVPKAEKRRRYNALMELQASISLNNNKKRVGGVEKVLIDEYRDGMLIGRSQRESPEVDGQILIELPKGKNGKAPLDAHNLIGKFAAVLITEALEYDLRGTLDIRLSATQG